MTILSSKNVVQSSTAITVQLIKGGKQYFDTLLRLIQNAKHTIHLQTYIFELDETGTIIANALIKAAQQKVTIYCLLDGYASQNFSIEMQLKFKNAGIHFRFFEPLFKSKNYYFGRRMHHKIFVADAKFALIGGINIANKYNDMPSTTAWLDFALFVEGTVAQNLCTLALTTWNLNALKPNAIKPCSHTLPYNAAPKQNSIEVSIRRNDWVNKKNEISATYIKMFQTAQSHITILCSYFLPGKIIRNLLKQATKRGVQIKIITTGTSDIVLEKHAERWMYDWLLRNNIQLYEYQASILHAKIAVCDTAWLTLGSYNVNNLSAYASIELNLDVYNANFAKDVEQTLQNIIVKNCIPITTNYHRKTTNIFIQLMRWSCYQLLRLLFFLLTFYYKQKS